MPNTRETVRALVSAFNVHNYARNTVETNFTLQSEGKKDYIVVSFEKSMDMYQCERYLNSIKRKIIREFYGIEESNDAEILDTAKLIFDVNSFPFHISDRDWSCDEQHGFKFVTPVDKGVIFNLKSHLAFSLKKDVQEDMLIYITAKTFNKEKYLWCGEFPNKQLREEFEREFLSRMENRYGYRNIFKKPLKVEGNSVYIKDVFDDVRFIDSVTRYIAWLEGMHLEVNSSNNRRVKLLKDMIIRSLYQSTGIMLDGFICAPPLGRKDASVLVPVILDDKGARLLTHEEALKLNYAFNGIILNNIDGKAQGEISVNGDREKYGIDFSNPEISHCVITKIIESSVINAKHELAIDPELVRALSPAQSPFDSPTHAEPSRTPLKQRQEDKDSGYDSNSPPRPKGSVAHSTSSVPGSLFEQPQVQGFPTRSQGEVEKSPRRGSEEKEETGGASQLLPGEGIGQISASSQQTNHLSSPPSAEFSSCSSRGTNESGSAWTNHYSLPPPPPLIPSSGGIVPRFRPPTQVSSSGPSSWKGANPVGANPWVQQTNRWSLQSSNLKEDCKKICEDFEEAYEKIVSVSSLLEEEKDLFKELLYWFNLNNHALDPPHTNFIVKNGKIASLIDDSVDVKEYLQEVIDKTKEEYRVNKKEAYDLNEFPFKFLPNCEKNQETTVVANISSGALLNLKKLFIRESEKEVEIEDIDINIVKKTVKSKKDEWVDSQVKKGMARPCEAITTCYPDKSALEYIPITEGKAGHWLDRLYAASEVGEFIEERKGTSKAKERKSEDNKDSGYSSGCVTDAKNVSSKAEATTSSGYESMDCENTREGSPKRTLELSMGMEELAISTSLDATEAERHSPTKKFRSN